MKQMLTNAELMTFFDQISMVLSSGISALEGIAMMKEDAASKKGQETLDSIYQSFEATGFFYLALQDAGVFPDYAVSMTEIGEKSGNLDVVTRSLSEYYGREQIIASAVKNAISYPLVMLGMMLIVIGVLMMKVMPVFEQVFEQLGASMTGFSAAVFHIGQVLNTYSIVFFVGFLVLLLCVLFFVHTNQKKGSLSSIVSKTPFTRRISEKIACTRFAGSMSLALKSGLDVDESLEMVGKITAHEEIQKKIQMIQEQLAQGEDFLHAFSSSGIFTGVYRQIIVIGYRTGTMDEAMNRIAHQYESEMDESLQQVIGRIEPTLVALLSILVGLILLSVMLPLIGIMANIS
jgi:type IV pilus assembly protein PilC